MSFFLDAYVLDAIRDGRFDFAYGPHPLISLILFLMIPAVVWFLYRRTTRPITRRWKNLLIGLRSAVLMLLLLLLMRPIITTFEVNPQETYLAVLVDDSASMQIADAAGFESRQQAVTDALYGENGIVAGLADRYQVRTFAFNQSLRRVSDASDLTAQGNSSSLEQAMRQVAEQLGGLPLSAVVMISDGADNADTDPLLSARDFAARQIPVFTVGVGQEQIPRDVGISNVSASQTILDNSVFDVQVDLNQQGYSGRQLNLRVMDGETEVASRLVTLGNEGGRRIELEISPDRKEPILYELRVDEQDGEIVLQNNRYQFLVDNSERPPLNVLLMPRAIMQTLKRDK
ncbi:MAG: hypothetical protein Q7L07_03415 [Pseudohongiella sp.]|nr:hypothetical protein [Pseudohongiella sp.]